MTFGELLKQYKERDRYSYRELADLIGRSKGAVVAWCYDIAKPSDVKDVLKLARIFKLPEPEADQFLLAAGHRPLKVLRQQAEMLTSDQREEMLDLLEFWGEEPQPESTDPATQQNRNNISPDSDNTGKSQAEIKQKFKLLLFVVAPLSIISAIAVIIFDQNHSMISIPAGPFQMGGDAEAALAECKKVDSETECQLKWFDNEEPAHQVKNLNAFHIDQYEVTNAQFAEFLTERGNQTEGGAAWFASNEEAHIYWTGNRWQADNSYADHPVVNVSWFGARAYCRWRDARLPTEAEWEKAARGTDGRLYPWGNTFDGTQANFCDVNCSKPWANPNYDDGYATTAPVGSYPEGVSPYGVHDMGGNVWEWVTDQYTVWGDERVVRGGAWDYYGSFTRTTVRAQVAPSDSNDHLGFRCVRSP